MAHDKPFRDIEVRPKTLKSFWGKGSSSFRSFLDKKRLLKMSTQKLLAIYNYCPEYVKNLPLRQNKIKKLIKRRKSKKLKVVKQ